MVFEKVRVFVEVDGLEGELAESLAPVCVGGGLGCDAAAAELGACAVLQGVRFDDVYGERKRGVGLPGNPS